MKKRYGHVHGGEKEEKEQVLTVLGMPNTKCLPNERIFDTVFYFTIHKNLQIQNFVEIEALVEIGQFLQLWMAAILKWRSS